MLCVPQLREFDTGKKSSTEKTKNCRETRAKMRSAATQSPTDSADEAFFSPPHVRVIPNERMAQVIHARVRLSVVENVVDLQAGGGQC